MLPINVFHSESYLKINEARLTHLSVVLDNLEIELLGKSVLELGAGIGDHSQFWIDRGCNLTITEPRDENLGILRSRFPGQDIRKLDLDYDVDINEQFDIVYAYGVLYHLADPQKAIATIGRLCKGWTFVETCVSYGGLSASNAVSEAEIDPSQAISGIGCRPTRRWVFEQLQAHFPYVYQPGTQPTHDQFPLDWRPGAEVADALVRTTFVAARSPVSTATMFPGLLDRQTRLRARSTSSMTHTAGSLVKLVEKLGISTVLDVGANVGQFARHLRMGGFTGKIISFEPLAEAFAILQRQFAGDSLHDCLPIALGDRDEHSSINVAANSASSSFLDVEPATLVAEPTVGFVEQRAVELRRLDSIWASLFPDVSDEHILLKLDVQGFEEKVLTGAGEELAQIDAVLIEMSLIPVYRGELVMADMLTRLSLLGFFPLWLSPGWSDPDSGQVFQCDVLLGRSSSI